jgi:hypothetical protein
MATGDQYIRGAAATCDDEIREGRRRRSRCALVLDFRQFVHATVCYLQTQNKGRINAAPNQPRQHQQSPKLS